MFKRFSNDAYTMLKRFLNELYTIFKRTLNDFLAICKREPGPGALAQPLSWVSPPLGGRVRKRDVGSENATSVRKLFLNGIYIRPPSGYRACGVTGHTLYMVYVLVYCIWYMVYCILYIILWYIVYCILYHYSGIPRARDFLGGMAL